MGFTSPPYISDAQTLTRSCTIVANHAAFHSTGSARTIGDAPTRAICSGHLAPPNGVCFNYAAKYNQQSVKIQPELTLGFELVLP